mmetsp:Transcript_10494/g.24906  ORF Transcript_10494/g.24906 Transcript_10494/m.24906 type:complete len:133 (-) Transcript_10494:49-447(-)
MVGKTSHTMKPSDYLSNFRSSCLECICNSTSRSIKQKSPPIQNRKNNNHESEEDSNPFKRFSSSIIFQPSLGAVSLKREGNLGFLTQQGLSISLQSGIKLKSFHREDRYGCMAIGVQYEYCMDSFSIRAPHE